MKSLVCVYSQTAVHFRYQAVWLKELFFKYRAKRLIIDANGLGIGLLDELVVSQILNETYYPPFGVYGGTYPGAKQEYKQFRTADTRDDAIYAIKANAPINSDAYSATQAAIEAGKLKFLIDERTAKAKLMATKAGQAMTPEQRNEYLLPYALTDILKTEMLNLREENEGVNIILKPINKNIKHDKVSALVYGMYYLREEEDNKRKREKSRITDFLFYN